MLDGKTGLRVAGLCGVIAPVAAFSFIFIAISLSPWFSWTANALSDLGVGEAAWVFNSGLMVSGVLAAVFGAGLWAAHRGQGLGRAGSVLFFAAAVALFGIGLFSEAAGPIHGYFSVAFFVLLPLALFVLGAGSIMAGFRWFGSLTILAGVLAGIPWAFSWDGVAIPEAISALVVSVWVVAEGARLYPGA